MILKEIAQICNSNIYNNIRAINYLKTRNINKQTIKEFNIGYMDKEILKYLCNKYKDFLVKNKILYINDDIEFSMLEDNIIIPIYDHYGEIISLSGRTISDRKPKYYHLPFNKSNNLFGLYNAIKFKDKDYIIVTEGQFDVMTAHQNNIKNICCTIGTTMTEAHIAILARYYEYIVICYDADIAGYKSAKKFLEKYCNININSIKIINYTLNIKGEDIDSYINKYGVKNIVDEIESLIYQ